MVVPVERVTDAIESGQYDNALREIARACFARRDVLRGGPSSLTDPQTPRVALAQNMVVEDTDQDMNTLRQQVLAAHRKSREEDERVLAREILDALEQFPTFQKRK